LPYKEIKLFATDLDGTLLDSSAQIPGRNADAVKRAMEKGVKATICTGRMFHSARKFAERLGIFDLPIVCYNGSMIRSLKGETWLDIKLDMEIARRVLALFKERGMYVQSYIGDRLYVKDPDDGRYQTYSKHFGIMGVPVGGALYEPDDAPTKLLTVTAGLAASHALIEELSATFGGALYVTCSNEDIVEMMNPAASKLKCLRFVAEKLGIAMENVMAMGDGENDVEMVAGAGLGIAVANARAAVRAAARETAPSNDECGVAWAIEKYILSD
jgi:Cof subfamily protein (haloacid dehalogenase superfamily)